MIDSIDSSYISDDSLNVKALRRKARMSESEPVFILENSLFWKKKEEQLLEENVMVEIDRVLDILVQKEKENLDPSKHHNWRQFRAVLSGAKEILEIQGFNGTFVELKRDYKNRYKEIMRALVRI